MKNIFAASLIKHGVLGGGLYIEKDYIKYHTNKLISNDLKNIVIPYKDIKEIAFSHFAFFPILTINTEYEKYSFIVYSYKKFLYSVKSISPNTIVK